MSDNGDYVQRTVIEEPATIRREEVRVVRESGSAGWWIAALVAIVAIVGVIFFMNSNTATNDDLQAARDQGAAEASLANAATNAQSAAMQASQAAQDAAAGATRATETAAQAAADRTAAAASTAAEAAQDATTTESAPAQ